MLLKYIEIGCKDLSHARNILQSQFNFSLVSENSRTCKLRKNCDNFYLTERNTGKHSVTNIGFAVECLKSFHSEMMRHNLQPSTIQSNCRHYPGIPFVDVQSPLPNLKHRVYEIDDCHQENGMGTSSLDHVLFGCHQLTAKNNALWYSRLLNLKQYHFKGSESGSMKVVVNGTGMEMFANFADDLPVFAFSEPIIEREDYGRNQIEQFLDANQGGGVQHIAFRTDSILETVAELRTNGVKIIGQPLSYYNLKEKQHAFAELDLDPKLAHENSIIVDQDEDGYLLQVFTESLFEKDGLFFEIIERRGCRGFGAGNVKALFSALQQDKASQKATASS